MSIDSKTLLNNLFGNNSSSIVPYTIEDSTGMIKLDAMESPFNLPDLLSNELANRISKVEFNRYPDSRAVKAIKSIRDWMKIPNELRIIAGNGSDELISILIMSIAGRDISVAAPDPSFSMFKILAKQYRTKFVPLSLDKDRDINVESWLHSVSKNNVGLVFIPQPNNPTGNLFDHQRLINFIDKTEALVIIDEAYTAFCSSNYLFLAQEKTNVIIMRTLSKIGLAAIRFGILAGNPLLLEQFDKFRLPYNVNSVTQVTVEFAYNHRDDLSRFTKMILRERERVCMEIKLLGYSVWESQTNFLVVTTPEGQAELLFIWLKKNGILVKLLHKIHPVLNNALRITVGQSFENNFLLKILSQFCIRGRVPIVAKTEIR